MNKKNYIFLLELIQNNNLYYLKNLKEFFLEYNYYYLFD